MIFALNSGTCIYILLHTYIFFLTENDYGTKPLLKVHCVTHYALSEFVFEKFFWAAICYNYAGQAATVTLILYEMRDKYIMYAQLQNCYS